MDPVTRLPRIDSNICIACGSCVKACPRHLIELRKKQESMIYVACNNKDKGIIELPETPGLGAVIDESYLHDAEKAVV